jgi:cytochrome P450
MQPFSFGPRNCIGRKYVHSGLSASPSLFFVLLANYDTCFSLAYVEMRIILARMIFNFDMELEQPGHNWLEQDCFLLWDKHPLMVKLSPRA